MKINTIHKEKLYFEDLEVGNVFYHKYFKDICMRIDDVFSGYDDCLNTVLLSNGGLRETNNTDEVILCDSELSVQY